MEKILNIKDVMEYANSMGFSWTGLLITLILCAACYLWHSYTNEYIRRQYKKKVDEASASLLNEINRLERDLSIKEQSNNDLYVSYVKLSDNYNKREKRIHELEKDLEMASAEIISLKSEIGSLKRSIATHKGNYTRLKKKYDELLASRNNVNSDSGCEPWRVIDLAD